MRSGSLTSKKHEPLFAELVAIPYQGRSWVSELTPVFSLTGLALQPEQNTGLNDVKYKYLPVHYYSHQGI